MGRRSSGVEVRASSIRLRFTQDGRLRTPTLKVNGASMAPTPANVRYAERLVAEIRERIELGTFSYAEYFPADGDSGDRLTLQRQMDTWLAAQRIEESTSAGYTSAIRFWTAGVPKGDPTPLGERPIRALKHSDFLQVLATRPDLSGKTVNNYVSVLRESLDLAVIDGALLTNPAAKIPRASHQKEPPDPFSLEEVDLIVADLLKHYPEPIGNKVEWWAFSGPRPSEVVALKWSSVDLRTSTVRIHEAVVRGLAKDRTKTNKSRDVMMNSRAAAALERQRKHTQLAGEHVWLDPRYGEPWTDERAFRRSYWTPCLKRLGIRYRAPRNLRHTYATMMLMAGRTPAWCAEQLGHSIEMFLTTYSRWIKGGQDRQEMDALDAWLLYQQRTQGKEKGA